MPIVFEKNGSSFWLAIWHICESVSELQQLVSPEEVVESLSLHPESRQREWLAWRAMLRNKIPECKVEYNAIGAPALVGSDLYIGVSHSGVYAAIICSSAPCAVDMECRNRDFGKASSRYISATERLLPASSHPDFNATMWCAKEVVYKNSGLVGLNLLDDIRITHLDFECGVALGRVAEEPETKLNIFTFNELIVVYTVGKLY